MFQCDGLDPCAFCVDNKLECLYSKEPRRRGPPSGYLRYTETRVAILEILLGLYLSNLPKKEDDEEPFDPFLEIAKSLQSEAKTCTQDVWDAHKAIWTRCTSAKLVEELVVSFAPFTPRSAQEAPAKTLLPPPPSTTTSTAHDRHSTSTTSPASHKDTGRKAGEKHRNSNQIPFTQTLRPESFERTGSHDHLTDAASPLSTRTQGEPGPTPRVASVEEQEQEEWQTNGEHRPYMNIQERASGYVPLAYPARSSQSYGQNIVSLQDSGSMGLRDTPDIELALGLGSSQEYTGSYW